MRTIHIVDVSEIPMGVRAEMERFNRDEYERFPMHGKVDIVWLLAAEEFAGLPCTVAWLTGVFGRRDEYKFVMVST